MAFHIRDPETDALVRKQAERSVSLCRSSTRAAILSKPRCGRRMTAPTELMSDLYTGVLRRCCHMSARLA